jgi:hypothetical protein
MSALTEHPPPIQPRPDPDGAGYWEALGDGTLAICRCTECGLWMHPPLARCRRCAGPTSFQPVSGQGTIYSFAVVRYPAVPGYQPPYTVALVDMDEQPGLRVVAQIADPELGEVTIGQRVRAEVADLRGGSWKVPVFRRIDENSHDDSIQRFH